MNKYKICAFFVFFNTKTDRHTCLQSYEEKAKEIGIRAYVMKPYLASEMATAIRRILDQGKEEKTLEKARVLVIDDEENTAVRHCCCVCHRGRWSKA